MYSKSKRPSSSGRGKSRGKGQPGGGGIVVNPAAGHSSAISDRVGQWSRTEGDILHYLGSLERIAEFADRTKHSEELANRIQPFLNNAESYMKSLSELAEGQASWTEIQKKYGSTIASAIAKIRQSDAGFNSDMEILDARERANLSKIGVKRQNIVQEAAAQLQADVRIEMMRHTNRMGDIADVVDVAQERQSVSEKLRARRRKILEKVTYGNRGRNALPLEDLPVQVGGLGRYGGGSPRRRTDGPSEGVSASGANRGSFGGLFSFFGER